MLNLMFVHLMGLLSPGPDFFYVSRVAAIRSRRTAIYGVMGITLGVFLWATAAVLGLAIVFKTSPALQGVVMALGGSYLFYLGVKMTRVKTNAVFNDSAEGQSAGAKSELLKGLLVNLSNAKVVIYFSSVMSFVLVNITETRQILTALLIITVETFLYFYVISILFSRPFARQFYSRYSRYIDNVSGVIFILFGIYLIYSGGLKVLG
ncbi:Threonine efflux protein [Aggregatibacter actinomycetemcomitans]|uniref:LysE family transporter n=1 Tax=Aggregatibacter actinomycetemcomitans TaxID=714 RepID=UPI0001B9F746|nr:LysE family transporter [Aggregatibacter actinomycetemcomitans]ACX82382.1 membrane protein [Aggregatibacter actinomycetemcomitans D11S-1]KOE58554.1 membrane protein [Aggregatibacter actinomycetemcomitans serotype c str. AAS4A]KOE58626.1 membrane protein [Aggregatibacter actinomycetemcomitans serotype c str. SCC2302]KOE58885.1 membrane protein [Aggregatibacter actinomycetemcomitans serotype c str. D17P-2]KYK75875.1 membrane protein [Aggregatibacter actinomycetemcomitans serotype e str. SA214